MVYETSCAVRSAEKLTSADAALSHLNKDADDSGKNHLHHRRRRVHRQHTDRAPSDANRIVVYDNYTRNTLADTPYNRHPNVTQVEGDVLDFERLKVHMQGAQIVVHAAAIAGIESTVRNPVTTMRVNMIGTANALEAGSSWTASSVSSSSPPPKFSARRRLRSARARRPSPVRSARRAGPMRSASWRASTWRMHTSSSTACRQVTVRPFNVYGPGQTGEGALSIFVRKALKNEDLLIFGDGTQIRAWCFVDDMVEGVLCALEHPAAIGESFNIGNARAVVTVYGLAEAVCRVVGSSSRILFRPALSADIELRIPNVDKARRAHRLRRARSTSTRAYGARRSGSPRTKHLLPALAPIFQT